MTKPYLKTFIERAIWRLSMTWHYILALAVVLSVLIITKDLSFKMAVICLALTTIGFMLLDVPLESRKWASGRSRLKSEKTGKKNASHLYKDLLEALPEPIMILNRNHQLLFSNEPARRFFNITRDGQDISSIIRTPEFLDALAKITTTKGEEKIHLLERVPIERQFTVRLRWVERSLKMNAPNLASRPAIIVHFYDLTEQERLNRMRSDFIANASHELRTPLASLLGFIETLQGAAKEDPIAREKFLDVMATQGRRMTRLIDDLLSLSRIEMNVHNRPGARVDLLPLINNSIDVLTPLAENQNITITCICEEEKVEALGSRDELAQVFQNLIHNAIKYGKRDDQPAATITVCIRYGNDFDQNKSKIIVEVKDEGIGIDPIHIPRLTERFYRVDIQQSKERGGTGLGLAITKHIITHHQGEMKIRSRLGEGSTFTVILPRA